MAARGGSAAALTGAAADGGLMGSVGRLFGATSFGSEAELGAAIRQISDLSSTIEAAREAIAKNRDRQEQISAKARDDERQFAFSDPAHREQLARLARDQQAQQQAAQQAQRQMMLLQQRAALTTNPAAQQAAALGRATTIIGAGATAASLAPAIIRNSAPVQIAGNVMQAGQQLAGNFATSTAGNIAGQMAGTAGRIGSIANPLNMGMSALRSPLGPLQEMSKLGVEIAKLPTHIQDWSQALIDSQKAIAKWSPALSRVFAEEERRGIIRGARSGQVTGGATSDLSDSMQDLLDQLQPIKDTVTVGLARGLTVGVNLLTEAVKYLQGIFEYVKTLPGADLLAAKIEGMELDSRIKAGNAMRPLLNALRDLERQDKAKPRSVPKR